MTDLITGKDFQSLIFIQDFSKLKIIVFFVVKM